ncbi:uncharacterized protein LOC128265788 [Drosophila gunungcola]|uniref:Enkurin domain-containing protein n=1 Tax=Drosophila gunungcola TaxID=103775 RepID=A0A9Q0BHV2_9MUSC|nr:uncharacterized protein LOC128265788 [Drosophila gunungcola]KAI8033257.1 hypothetical protein M5D96_013973 [Drosophila gunungcola]
MMSLRRAHGGGRDFLQENKQNVSRMEPNGRGLAAANARRVPLWRPVVLHYAEKLRPHIQSSQQLRTRQTHSAAHEAPNLRSGLAQPYGFKSDQRRRQPPNPCGCDLDKRQAKQKEQERLQGGWVDQQKEKAPRRCCQGCHCHQTHQGHQGQMITPHQGHQGQVVADHQGHQAETVGHQIAGDPAVNPKQGEGDQADRVSLCSRVSRMSHRSQRTPDPSQENTDPEAPLSARSRASAKTLKSKRSVSQESIRSTATIKSNITVASRGTTVSKRSQVSRKSKIMEVMPPPAHLQDQKVRENKMVETQAPAQGPEPEPAPKQAPEGYTPLTKNERNAALQDAHFKYGKLVEEYNHLPVSEPTLRVRNRKMAIERQLDELDYAINMFDQPHLDMYYKK